MGVDHLGTILLRANTVLPMVLIGKASAGPAEVWNFDMPQGSNYVIPYTPGIGYNRRRFRIVSHPIAPVYAPSQVFRKVAVNVTANFDNAVLGFNYDSVHKYAPLNSISLDLFKNPVGSLPSEAWLTSLSKNADF
jgi:hypothetical protein